MKIIDVRPLHLRLDEVSEVADGSQDVLLVEVDTDEGITGVGEASSCSYVCRAIVEAPRSAASRHGLREIVVGRDPFDIAGNWRLMYEETARYGRSGVTVSAIGAVDLALWDICGKARGQPVHALLGGKLRQRVRAYASFLFGSTPEQTFELARMARERGLTAVKFGWGPFGADEITDVSHVAAARDALGAEVELMIDAGQSWNAETALRRAEKLVEFDVKWLEEPLDATDVSGYAWLCERSPIPIAGAELATSKPEFQRLIEEGGLQIVQPDVTICGGLTAAVEVAEIAYAAGRRTIAHSFSTGVSLLASLHWMASRPDGELVEYCLSGSPLMRDLVVTTPSLEEGRLNVPDTPGLGIELNADLVARYSVPRRRQRSQPRRTRSRAPLSRP